MTSSSLTFALHGNFFEKVVNKTKQWLNNKMDFPDFDVKHTCEIRSSVIEIKISLDRIRLRE